jgi:orotate phosphoribosyltransferase-like protein
MSDTQSDLKQKRRPGRPSVLESKGDPNLASKAAEMRSLGLSWSQIAFKLGVGRTTARRLVLMCQKRNESQIGRSIGSTIPKHNDTGMEGDSSQHVSTSIDNDILGKLPKTFQIFSMLLEEARKTQPERRV